MSASSDCTLGLLVQAAYQEQKTGYLKLPPGYTLIGEIYGQDALMRGSLHIDESIVTYGFAARDKDGKTIVALRGTDDFVEGVEDAEFALMPYGDGDARMESGFASVYATLTMDGLPLNYAIGKEAGSSPVIVTGHSLGAAMAAYLALDLARDKVGVSLVSFAMPNPGDAAFAAIFDKSVGDYRTYAYALDVVPKVPGWGYQRLKNTVVLQPSRCKVGVRLSVLCAHSLTSYCALLDYPQTLAAVGSLTCILPSGPGLAARLLADAGAL